MKKDKSVVTDSPSGSGVAKSSSSSRLFALEEEESERKQTSNNFPPLVARSGSSRYDFVKVKVWLGDNADHYYVLSRFLLSRMLTVTKIPNHMALKIALELKKLLVDNSLLDVSQSDLETNLFKLMKWRGYGQEYINRYKMMTRFHHQRVPLVILVCGTACVGKSTIATQLAQRLNLPNVLQTDMVHELLRTSTDVIFQHRNTREIEVKGEGISLSKIYEPISFFNTVRHIFLGLAGDLKKAMKDGKPIIIEGMHVDPGIYLIDEERKSPNNVPLKAEEAKCPKAHGTIVENDASLFSIHDENSHKNAENFKTQKATSAEEMNNAPDGLKSVESVPENITNNTKGQVAERKPTHKREKSGDPQPIIIPIVLKMAEFDHKALLEEWISTHRFNNNYPIKDKDKLISNIKTIQDYLCSFQSQSLAVANISATTFPQTLDWLHNHLLLRIEQGISSAAASDGSDDQTNGC